MLGANEGGATSLVGDPQNIKIGGQNRDTITGKMIAISTKGSAKVSVYTVVCITQTFMNLHEPS